MPGRTLEQLLLPIRHAGFGLPCSSELGAKVAFLSGAASAQMVMKDASQMFRPFDGPSRAAFAASWQRYTLTAQRAAGGHRRCKASPTGLCSPCCPSCCVMCHNVWRTVGGKRFWTRVIACLLYTSDAADE